MVEGAAANVCRPPALVHRTDLIHVCECSTESLNAEVYNPTPVSTSQPNLLYLTARCADPGAPLIILVVTHG